MKKKPSTIKDVIASLSQLGIELSVNGEKLIINSIQKEVDPKILDLIRSRKSEIIAFYSDLNSYSPLEKLERGVDCQFALSYSQERLWFLDQYEGTSASYNIPIVIRLKGKINIAAFQKALNQFIKKHEVFRSTFHESEDGHPIQKIHKSVDISLEIVTIPSELLNEEIERLSLLPFDLSKLPLFHATLFEVNTNEFVFFFNHHHIISDGWSVDIMFREFSELYRSELKGDFASLIHSEYDYVDFAAWQKAPLQQKSYEKMMSFWHDSLSGFQTLELPTDFSRPLKSSKNGNSVLFSFNEQLINTLKEIAQINGASLFTILLSAFNILLSRYSGQDDIVVGSPIANRNHLNIENIFGFFVNTLVYRNTVKEEEKFIDQLKSVTENALLAYENQEMPFEKVVESLEIQRDMSRNPIFQIMFVLQSYNKSTLLNFPGADVIEYDYLNKKVANFDLTVNLEECASGVQGRFNYSTDLYNQNTIEEMIEHYNQLLIDIANNPEQLVKDLSLKVTNKTQAVLEKINNSNDEFTLATHTLPDLFVNVAIKNPTNTAVITSDATYDYQYLLNNSSQLAHKLIALNVKANELVAIITQKGVEQVISCLGILQSGAAYLPVNIEWPIERIKEVLTQGKVNVVLCTSIALSKQSEQALSDFTLLKVDDKKTWSTFTSTPLLSRAKLDDIAYVIFTSGSTGKPKGVTISHRGVVNTLNDMNQRFSVNSTDKVLALSNLSFDLSVYDIFGLLLAGGAIVFPSDEAVKDPELYIQQMVNNKVTIWNSVPMLMQMLVEFAKSMPLKMLTQLKETLRVVLLSGDYIPLDLPTSVREKFPKAEVISLGGATEASIWSILYPISFIDPNWKSIPYGFAMKNQKIYVLNKNLQQCPVGVIGEIHIGGVGLAVGYWGDEERTQASFIIHPKTRERLYKTGDYGKYDNQNYIEFKGRKDTQIKIKGNRIEIGEIEYLLSQLAGVKQALVIVREEEWKYLAAYYILHPNFSITKNEVKDYLKSYLPDYMIPDLILEINSIPLTANGKVDRKQLPSQSHNKSNESYVAPKSEIENTLAKIWCEILNLSQVGVHDQFFEIGGNSLLSVKMRSKIETILKIKINIIDIFQYPTIQLLVSHIQSLTMKSNQGHSTIQLQSASKTTQDHNIAIIGMSCRVPKAENISEFWKNLVQEVDCISNFSDEEMLQAGVARETFNNPSYVKRGGVIQNFKKFDAAFFGYSPIDALTMDPQQRHFLECAWESLEDAAIHIDKYSGRIGVYAGQGRNEYYLNHLHGNKELVKNVGDYQLMLNNEKDYLTTRVSYKLNLNGPSVNIQSACSTSLVAIDNAIMHLLANKCDVALAGGVTLVDSTGYIYAEGMIASPDGYCRPFDKSAQGTLAGSAVGVVVLKKLSNALKDGDHIYAVIKGSATNNDGNSKVSYSAPSVLGQARVIDEALQQAQVHPETITYVEAHGTGTVLGDPIEIAALTKAYRRYTNEKQYCAIGSVKSSIGHTDAAAGVIGVIKTALALKNKLIPASLHFTQENPEINFSDSPFYVNTKLTPFRQTTKSFRRGAVSSFGIGGTNAHIILEEAPDTKKLGPTREKQLFVFSAKSFIALNAQKNLLEKMLKNNAGISVADVAHTLQIGRAVFNCRGYLVVDQNNAINELSKILPKSQQNNFLAKSNPEIIFMFSGQGSQYINMGKDLYEKEGVFSKTVNDCCRILIDKYQINLLDVMYPLGDLTNSNDLLNQTNISQPALFIIEYALAILLESFGIKPDVMIGHSLGEYVAATLAGVFSLEDALHLVVMRGKFMQKMKNGVMLSVKISSEEIIKILPHKISLAAINSPENCIISGTANDIDTFILELNKKNIQLSRLHTSHAFHSPMMTQAAELFLNELCLIPKKSPKIKFISNLTGKYITAKQAQSNEYWLDHMLGTVLFSDGIDEVCLNNSACFIEIGPGNTLKSLALKSKKKTNTHVILNCLPHPKENMADTEKLYHMIGQLFLAGVDIDWSLFSSNEVRNKISLPTYPFERKIFWVNPQEKINSTRSPLYASVFESIDEDSNSNQSECLVNENNPNSMNRDFNTKIKSIWKTSLGIDSIEMDDNFFDLGGHSLIATKIISRIQTIYKVKLSIKDVYENPQLQQLVTLIESSVISGKTHEENKIIPIDRTKTNKFDLSFAQGRLFFIDELEGKNGFYNLPIVLNIKGKLNSKVLEKSIHKLCARHESFRTTFHKTENGDVFQLIAIDIHVPLVQLNNISKEELPSFIQKEMITPFDITNGPLIRVKLIHISEEEFIFIFNHHHIISDGWSIDIICQELSEFYKSIIENKEHNLVPLPIQVADFSLWQRNEFKKESYQQKINYWRDLLTDCENLELYTDFPRPVAQSYRGHRVSRMMGKSLSEKLQLISKDYGASFFTLLLTAFNILLHRYSGQDDIVIGSPVANRTHQDLEWIVGFFVNTLSYRTKIISEQQFNELLETVNQQALNSFENQDVPLDQLIEVLGVKRDLSRNPLFQVLLVLQNANTDTDISFPNTEISINKDVRYNVARFDLTLEISDIQLLQKGDEAGYLLELEYATDLFTEDTAQRMLLNFVTLLESIAKKPTEKIKQLCVISDVEKNQVLLDYNFTQLPVVEQKSVNALFELQVRKTPDAVAVISGDKHLTYQELNLRANQLARSIRQRYKHHYQAELPSDAFIGLCLDRSFFNIIGMLGVLKAGAVYVPLDSEYPEERLEFMLKNSNAALILTQNEKIMSMTLFEKMDKNQLIVIDDLETKKEMSALSGDDGVTEVSENQGAYVIYTSGSTGTPKGVLVTHNSIGNLAVNSNYVEIGPSDCVAQIANTAFDATTFEVYASLLNGAKLVLFNKEDILDINGLSDKFSALQVSVMFVTTALFNMMVQHKPSMLSRLKYVLFGGEKVSVDIVNQYLEKTGASNLIHVYGPTETTTFATYYPIIFEGKKLKSVPIGYPLKGVQLFVLDKHYNVCPVGVPGELYIGGLGLARGYLNKPELTEASFIQNPFSEKIKLLSGNRLYKTGDLVRWLPNGSIEYVDRIDSQVKIRGFRIELNEIQNALLQHPGVHQAVVVVNGENNDKYIAAYYVENKKKFESLSGEELKSFLKQRLPSTMIPNLFAPIHEIPLTPNGKLNRKALLNQTPKFQSKEFVAPRNAVEKQLTIIFCEVLKVNSVSIYDDFFELGGHSLLAIQLASRIEFNFHVTVSIKDIFSYTELYKLAELIEYSIKNGFQSQHIVIPKCAEKKEYPLSASQAQLWFIDQYEGQSTNYHISVAFRLVGELNINALQESIHDLIARHDSFRTTFHQNSLGELTQRIQDKCIVPLNLIDICHKNLMTTMQEETKRPFDLSDGPLVRVTLYRLTSNEFVFLFTHHHIISDGASVQIIFNEISEYYAARVLEKEVNIAKLPIHFVDYACWQLDNFKKPSYLNKLQYWKNLLSGYQPLKLPINFTRPEILSHGGKSVHFKIEGSVTSILRQIAKENSATLFTVILSAFNVLLSLYSAQEDIVVGCPTANRNHKDLENLVGFFANSIVYRTKIQQKESFVQLLKNVTNQSLNSYENQDVPFKNIVEALNIPRVMNQNPIFNVSLVLQNIDSNNLLSLPGVTVIKYDELDSQTSKFNMTLNLQETDIEINGSLLYATDLYTNEFIFKFVNHFNELLKQIVENPKKLIQDLNIINYSERIQSLIEWNNTDKKYLMNDSICKRFENQVLLAPDHTALVFNENKLSYRELNDRVNRLSRTILDQVRKVHNKPLGSEIIIALCLDRSMEMIVSMLAILKAGAAYLSIDSDFKSERIEFILAESKAALLLTEKKIHSNLNFDRSKTLILDEKKTNERIEKFSCENLNVAHHKNNLAYVIYTSGTSGKPKGVQITHANLCNYVDGFLDHINLSTAHHFALVSTISADLGYSTLYSALFTGKTLHIMSRDTSLNQDAFAQFMIRHQIDVLKIVPSHLKGLIDLNKNSAILPKHTLILGGEVFTACFAETIYKMNPNLAIYNHYGPTESTVGVLTHKYKSPAAYATRVIPLGKPLPNSKVYILDPALRLCPVGVPGELYIGGAGLAKGYLNRPDLTAERFIQNPFANDLGLSSDDRIYKTGDLVKRLPDSDIEYISRTDFQIKIRGYRVELGEIENSILSHPAINQVVVVAKDKKEQTYLEAYYVLKNNSVLFSVSELRDFIAQHLPNYMIPSSFTQLEKIPLTTNGKIDRNALPSSGLEFSSKYYIAPRNEMEEDLLEIWTLLLPVKVGVIDNFFELGGHSLLALLLVNRINQKFKTKLTVAWIFKQSTIELQALALLESLNDSMEYQPIISFNSNGNGSPLFLIHPGGMGAEVYAELSGLLGKDQPCYGIDSYNRAHLEHPISSIKQLAELYICNMKKMQPNGPYLLGGWSLGGMIACEMAAQLKMRGDDVNGMYLIDSIYRTEKLKKVLNAKSSQNLYLSQLKEKFIGSHITEEQFAEHFKLMELESEMANNHQFHPLKNIPTLLFRAKSDQEYASSELNDFNKKIRQEKNSINNFDDLISDLSLHDIDANHDSIMKKNSIRRVAEIIKQDLLSKR